MKKILLFLFMAVYSAVSFAADADSVTVKIQAPEGSIDKVWADNKEISDYAEFKIAVGKFLAIYNNPDYTFDSATLNDSTISVNYGQSVQETISKNSTIVINATKTPGIKAKLTVDNAARIKVTQGMNYDEITGLKDGDNDIEVSGSMPQMKIVASSEKYYITSVTADGTTVDDDYESGEFNIYTVTSGMNIIVTTGAVATTSKATINIEGYDKADVTFCFKGKGQSDDNPYLLKEGKNEIEFDANQNPFTFYASGETFYTPTVIQNGKMLTSAANQFSINISDGDVIDILMTEPTATFDNITLDSESVYQAAGTESGSKNFTSGLFTFTNVNSNVNNVSYYYGFTLSNKTTTTGTDYTNPYEVACGGPWKGSNFAVFYPQYSLDGTLIDQVVCSRPMELTGCYITNTTYAINSIINGDSYAKGLRSVGDYFMLTIYGYNENGEENGSIDLNLAYVDEQDSINYLNDWYWVDLRELGTVKTLKFSFSGTDAGAYGLNTPTYFAMDDLCGNAPQEGYACTYAKVQVPTGIDILKGSNGSSATADMLGLSGKFIQNGRVVILRNNRGYSTMGESIN